jgi:hypothetical protein
MTKLTIGLSVIYVGGDLAAAFRAVEVSRVPGICIDNAMAARISVQRNYPATVTRVIDENTVDIELKDLPEGDPRQRFAVKHGTGPNTFRFADEESSAGES